MKANKDLTDHNLSNTDHFFSQPQMPQPVNRPSEARRTQTWQEMAGINSSNLIAWVSAQFPGVRMHRCLSVR